MVLVSVGFLLACSQDYAENKQRTTASHRATPVVFDERRNLCQNGPPLSQGKRDERFFRNARAR